MNTSTPQQWLRTAILVGVLYAGIGTAIAAIAGTAASNRGLFLWRLSAFVLSGVVFAVHIAQEHFRRRNPAQSTAWHVAVAVAFGGFALALVANLHDLGSAAGYRPRMLIALAAWPLLTAVPAFLVALVAAAGLGAMKR
jgi:hypothetical protein